MRRLANLRAYRALVDAQKLMAAHARQVAADDLARETHLRAALKDQEIKLETSLEDWSSCLGSQKLDPQQLQRLGADITRLDLQRTRLAEDVEAAAFTTDAARLRVAAADTQARLGGDALKDMKKAAARDRDETAARSLEDRIAYIWSEA